MKKNIILILILFLMFPFIVSAQAYSTSNDLFENNYSNNLIDMASIQIKDFYNKKYVIFQYNNYDYYLIASDRDDVTINNNSIIFKNSFIFRCQRLSSGSYNYYYQYSNIEESSTTVNLSHIVLSNINTSYSVSSKRIDDYSSNFYILRLLILSAGLLFAIFLNRERSYL